MRARDGGAQLVAAYNHARAGSTEPLAAVDTAGKVVIADDTASVLLVCRPTPRQSTRWCAGIRGCRRSSTPPGMPAGRRAVTPIRIGSTQIFTHLVDEPTPIGICPVFQYGNLVGHLISFGAPDGETLPDAEVGAHTQGQPRRVVGVRESRMVLLRLPEVTLAEAEGNEVWLSTDQGRLRAASSGLDKLDDELANAGFLRVHRRYVVNLGRVREVELSETGASWFWSWTTRTRLCRCPGATRARYAVRLVFEVRQPPEGVPCRGTLTLTSTGRTTSPSAR